MPQVAVHSDSVLSCYDGAESNIFRLRQCDVGEKLDRLEEGS